MAGHKSICPSSPSIAPAATDDNNKLMPHYTLYLCQHYYSMMFVAWRVDWKKTLIFKPIVLISMNENFMGTP